MSGMRLYDGIPIDRLTATLAVILHHLIAGPVTKETYRDIIILAQGVISEIDTGGDCEGDSIDMEDLIEAVGRAEKTYEMERDKYNHTVSVKYLRTCVHRQIVEAKNVAAIRGVIKQKGLTCKHCQRWQGLPLEGQKYGDRYKRCPWQETAYEFTPACTSIDLIEEDAP